MTLKYILRSFRRRKVRMIIILLSIIFGVGMVVSLSAGCCGILRSKFCERRETDTRCMIVIRIA